MRVDFYQAVKKVNPKLLISTPIPLNVVQPSTLVIQ